MYWLIFLPSPETDQVQCPVSGNSRWKHELCSETGTPWSVPILSNDHPTLEWSLLMMVWVFPCGTPIFSPSCSAYFWRPQEDCQVGTICLVPVPSCTAAWLEKMHASISMFKICFCTIIFSTCSAEMDDCAKKIVHTQCRWMIAVYCLVHVWSWWYRHLWTCSVKGELIGQVFFLNNSVWTFWNVQI